MSGAGAAALACLDLLGLASGLRQDNLMVVDVEGVVYAGRREALMDPYKEARFARPIRIERTLGGSRSSARDIFPRPVRTQDVVSKAMVRDHGGASR